MTNKNTDIFKLVEEVNKQKTKESQNIDDVFSMLDGIKDVEVNDVKNTINQMNPDSGSMSSLNDKGNFTSRVVKRPTLAKPTKSHDSRYNCFMDMIANVDYGTSNSQEYVNGHKEALSLCIKQAENNPDDLYMVEAMINDELNRNTMSSIYAKGYKDGMTYASQALKYSKAELMNKIYIDLKNNL